MTDARRLASVVRVRDLQARVAEAAAAARTREAEARHAAVAEAHAALDRAVDDASSLSFLAFAQRQTSIEGALFSVHRRTDEAAEAQRSLDAARHVWTVARQRHEGVERLHDRLVDDERTDALRQEQREVDDLVTITHARTTRDGDPG
ncbi:MAG: flagellar export protein FliJ [Actinomycetota bacterium]